MIVGHDLAAQQLKEIVERSSGTLELVAIDKTTDANFPIKFTLSLDCREFQKREGGLPLRERERLIVHVPASFPFQPPVLHTPHRRFAGFPHVQWGYSLCLYQSTATEWIPSDGMYGFVDRVRLFFEKGAQGELNPTNEPLHPPIAYPRTAGLPTIVPVANTPLITEKNWLGYALLKRISDHCLEVVGWSETGNEQSELLIAPAILLKEDMPFEFPSKINDLTDALAARGVGFSDVFGLMWHAADKNPEGSALFTIVGTPMRGVAGGTRIQHLSAWYVPTAASAALKRFITAARGSPEDDAARTEVVTWFVKEPVEWCTVREDRPEVTVPRDSQSELTYFKGKTVALWGCGAIGSQIAEMLARAGASKLILRDSGTVAPGLLVRQNFKRSDIGKYKVEALKHRLQEVSPNILVETFTGNLKDFLAPGNTHEAVDAIFESTGSIAVLDKIEQVRKTARLQEAPIFSLAVGHTSKQGILVYSPPEFTGGPKDLYRKTKLVVTRKEHLASFSSEFWPVPSRTEIFQPEPGCSEATFRGSIADSLSLVAPLLNFAAERLQKHGDTAATFLVNSSDLNRPISARTAVLEWQPDVICQDSNKGFEVRLAASAWKDMRAWISRNTRVRTDKVETGGVLLGETDEASGVVWISEVTGPPPDSIASEKEFTCGVQGLSEMAKQRATESKGSNVFVGMWHTHPVDFPIPSSIDLVGMRQVVGHGVSTPRLSTMLIVGGRPFRNAIGAYVFRRTDTLADYDPDRIYMTQPSRELPECSGRIGLALSGGGSRAMAFHLGCLRALNDRGLLDRIHVISGISGGSVLGGAYAYSHDSFEAFDRRIVKALRSGFVCTGLKKVINPLFFLPVVFTILISGTAAFFTYIFRKFFDLCSKVPWIRTRAKQCSRALNLPPLLRWRSRSDALERAFASKFFGETKLIDKRRNGVHVVLTACELQTGTAFRFGTKESGNWKFGKLANNTVPVSLAVAASACYPTFLPALDRMFSFMKKGETKKHRSLLADGGVYENIGITPLEPGRDESISTNTFPCEYIIACNAGAGSFDETGPWPYWVVSRVLRSFDTIFRRVQESSSQRLYDHLATGRIKGLIYSYLGQDDRRLPFIPADLVRRERVKDYPTEFFGMSKTDLELLTNRGEQLTRLLLTQHCPEL